MSVVFRFKTFFFSIVTVVHFISDSDDDVLLSTGCDGFRVTVSKLLFLLLVKFPGVLWMCCQLCPGFSHNTSKVVIIW